MSVPGICFLLLLAQLAGTSRGNTIEKTCTCGSVAELACMAPAEPGVSYRSVRWYKIDNENNLRGLVRKRLSPQNNTAEYYKGLIRHVEFVSENSSNLVLPNMTASDRGRYICLLAAPLGHQNQEGEVFLRVEGCPSYDLSELVWAIALLSASLLLLSLSYMFLRNALRSSKKKLLKESLWKMSHQHESAGNMIYVMGKDGLKAFEAIYV
ncbi:hypothetical protein AALO_G00181600 [Alosa alosa]|uniref:Ig-like domain-containing protein n=1 Tax=Alosa alosa TaxID=278164 RepID=A0AAV6GCJ5_9TELE|nr:CD83 antigen [Alosa alosa]KAG5271576.1 hypothetical protein AALO_G00181600 [Alosa alosa]